jgi:hypothetical protein
MRNPESRSITADIFSSLVAFTVADLGQNT